MSKVFGIYTVHRNNDGQRAGNVTDVCSSKQIAKVVAHKSGWYGGDAPIMSGWAVDIDGVTYLLAHNHPVDLDGKLTRNKELLKKKALDKLSPEEIEVLGIELNAI